MAHLTEQKRLFIDEYLANKCTNATKAAIAAGYSEHSAKKLASRLLACPAVQEELQRHRAAAEERTLVTAERVLREYARIAFANPSSFLPKEDGGLTLADLQAMSEDDLAAITELTAYTHNDKTTYKVRLQNKIPALDALARYLGLNEKDNKQRGIDSEFWTRLIAGVSESRSLPSSRTKLE